MNICGCDYDQPRLCLWSTAVAVKINRIRNITINNIKPLENYIKSLEKIYKTIEAVRKQIENH